MPEPFFVKVVGLRPATILKKRPWHRRFSVNFAKFLIAPIFIEHLRWLLQNIYSSLLFSANMCSNVFAPHLHRLRSGTLLCGVTFRNSAPIPSSTRNRNFTRVGADERHLLAGCV